MVVIAAGERPRRGRPPRIDRAMIAKAAYEVGLERLTMRAVADRLGVSVPGLYHHVQSRNELVRLGAEYVAAQIAIPVDRGQHWAVWLLEWAGYNYDAFVTQPALLSQFVNGSIGLERTMRHLEDYVEVMVRQRFTPVEALEAYELVADVALGAAIGELRRREAAHADDSIADEYQRVLAEASPSRYRYLREVAASGTQPNHALAPAVVKVLVGIAVCRGEDWTSLVDLAAPSPTNGQPS